MRQCPRFHSLGPFSGDQSEKTIYARISGSISEHCWWQSLRMLPSFIVVRVKGGFFICGKVEKTIGTTEYFKDKFRLRESLESSRLWEKNFCCGKLSD